MNRDDFLAGVEEAAVLGRAHRVKTRDLPDTVGYVGCGDDRCAALAAEVQTVGGEIYLVANDEEACDTLAKLLAEIKPAVAFCWKHPLLDRLQVTETLRHHNIDCHDFDSLAGLDDRQRRTAMLSADVGISSVDFAVAETASLVVCSKPGQERMVSLLPPVHVALIDEAQIVPDLFDLFGRLQENNSQALPSNLAFITGPSKTGDIELQLTTGVHGPGRWIVVIIRG
ncbi:MAG: lactate utilization protein [Pirellulaceae bacterium]|jgi:L-lactate dehydrogenase complex protein LldG|nr:lactate utilization protein [Pirellulaceae bacterium]MDP6721852.1 lactate utilization protein [Pirellulaceae bacterium]